MNKVLVAGGAGYIGSHVVYELIDAGFTVVVVDNLSTGYIENIDSRAKFVNGNIYIISSTRISMVLQCRVLH